MPQGPFAFIAGVMWAPPDDQLERQAGYGAGRQIAGVDEVGRGPLAGPVVAVALLLPTAGLVLPPGLVVRDSKQLSATARARLAPVLRDQCIWAVGSASVAEIDALNILRASLLAMARAVAALAQQPDLVLVDGNQAPILPMPVQTVVGGDRRCLSIAAAAIIAKEIRDQQMRLLDTQYPVYGFARHAGYGTVQHRAALATHGPCPEHRRSFRGTGNDPAVVN